ncbi:up-regulator of cell proliferation-like [Leptodactylus fuscus]|uniref:up-regulator of cell proliferation-like n=1 Tax=Leptodactylus fuscus TaxID=238119 RepID=UPI003F4EF844
MVNPKILRTVSLILTNMVSKERLLEVFEKILQSNLPNLEHEVETFLQYTLKHDALDQMEDPRGKVQEVLNILHERGEEACQGFLDNLNKNSHLFPKILCILNEQRMDKATFNLVVEDLGLRQFLHNKLTLARIQSIGCSKLSDAPCRTMKDIPMDFLKHLMALNIQEAFRNFNFNHGKNSQQDTLGNVSGSVHPLDVVCGLLHCSDNFLRQEIIRRMAMCQVPVPLLLPAAEEPHSTFLLWAMRGITKSLGTLTEHNIVDISMPVFSFVSLGESRCIPIAKIINHIQNDLVHREMSWGDMPRHISDGLVEISWYFPADQLHFEKPFAMLSLHGNLQSNMRQFNFLTKVSSAVFILMENMTKQQWDLLSQTGANNKNYYFITQDQINHFCHQSLSELGLTEQNVLMQLDENFDEKLKFILKDTMQRRPIEMTLSEMSVVASKFNFCSDENQYDCEYGRLHSLELMDDIGMELKRDKGDVLRNCKVRIAKIEKQLCRLRNLGELHTTENKSQLTNEMYYLQMAQYWYNYSDVMTNLRYAFTYLNKAQQQYFLKWIQLQQFSANTKSSETIQEEVFCKIGQMYEAELTPCIAEDRRLYANFPEVAADLLLQGIPIELIDGDTGNIHLQWITDVLLALDTKTKGKCRIRVISVVGVQGTGKSTLLNTMFGLQFPVGCRQCTRGALMSLIKVEEKILGCHFLLIIDCEGLQALDNASVEENYDHDNELATLVVGFSDISIINMALGSISEMQNILEIVVHALLRMRETGKRPNCLLVYQMMEGESFEEETMRETKDKLCLGAQIAKNSKILQCNDTIECNILEDYWVIPPFHLKTSYSEKVIELKRYLLQLIKYQYQPESFRNVQNFTEDIKSLLNSVKNDNFIFRFKNILEGKIYTEIYERFLELEWNLCRKMHRWWVYREDQLSKPPPGEDKLEVEDVLKILNEEARTMEESLQVYFSDRTEDTYCYEAKKFEVEFMEKIESLKNQLETHYTNKCMQLKILRRGLVKTILEDFIKENWDSDETNFNGELHWKNAVAKYKAMTLKNHNVEEEFLQLLRRDMRTKGSLVNELIQSSSNLSDYAHATFTYDSKYVNKSWFMEKCNHMENCTSCHSKRGSFVQFITEKSNKYIYKMTESETVYDPVHGMDLLNMVNEIIHRDAMPYTVLFELDLKLQILTKAAPCFQKMHDDFLKKIEAQFAVDDDFVTQAILGLGYIAHDKRVVKNYCQDLLKPVVELKVKNMFMQNLISDYTNYMFAVNNRQRTSSEGSHGLGDIHHAPPGDTLQNIYNRFTDKEEIQVLITNMVSKVIQDIREMLQFNVWKIEKVSDNDLVTALWSVLEEETSVVRRNISYPPLNLQISTVSNCAVYFNFFLEKLQKQIQKELSFQSIREHYMQCPYWIH